MICSAHLHHPYVSSFVEKDNVSFSEVIQNIPLLGTMVPKDVHSMIRAKLEPCEYDEEHQIRALFSRWSKKYRKGTLQEPVAADSNDDNVPQEDPEDCDDCNNEEEQRSKLV